MSDFLILLLYLAVFLGLSFVYVKQALQMFQQNHYELYRYSKWLFNKKNLRFTPTLIFVVLILTIGTLLKQNRNLIVLFLTLAFAVYMIYQESKKVYIKDLVVTARVKRQIIVFVILMSLFIILGRVLPCDILAVLCIIMSYLFVYPMALITMPIEEGIKNRYESQARQILKEDSRLINIDQKHHQRHHCRQYVYLNHTGILQYADGHHQDSSRDVKADP